MSPQEGFTQKGRAGVRANIFRPRNLGIQGHEVTRNTQIDQSIYHKGDEAPMLNPLQVKDNNVLR